MDVGHTIRDGRTWETGEDTGEITTILAATAHGTSSPSTAGS